MRSVCPNWSDFHREMLQDIEEECRRIVGVVDSDYSVLLLRMCDIRSSLASEWQMQQSEVEWM